MIYSTEYVVEYRFEEEDEWATVWTFDNLHDARKELVAHVQQFHHANCRIREVTEVRTVEERIRGEYTLGEEA